MQLDRQIHNFRVTAVKPVDELAATMYEMEHVPTGARLVWLDRVSDNKTFGIAFRTTPEDDTGVFHILEHSVLCGSERYPVKEPFVELMKSSMQTFLNAMTFPDKTFYPVSSRNDKDFRNLMRVYLDAVFFPAIYHKPEIFRQEGWHYELREGAEPCYKGVVFNEMKGAKASPDSIMNDELQRRLFPDSCYRFVSGGDPAHIPELTYEQFLASHRRFYHPSNSYIFLDGTLDPENILQIIDGEYLCRFQRQAVDSEIALQAPVKAEDAVCCYEISPSESLEKKARVAWGFGMGDYSCRTEQVAMEAIASVLCSSNQAPLKQEILSAGLAEDVNLSVDSGILQNFAVISADNLDENRLPELKDIITRILRQQADNGLDREHIRAVLANMELRARERDYGWAPQGLGFGMEVLSSWLYGGDPAANLTVGPLFAELNALVDTGWYEQLLRRVLLENPHTCQVLLLPSYTTAQEQRQAEDARIAQAKAGWDAETLAALQTQQDALDAWQASVDSPEDVAKLPTLELSDIAQQVEDIPTEMDACNGVTVLRHDLPTGGISYWTLYFDISDLDEQQLSNAAMLCNTAGELDTEHYSALEMQKRISGCMGDLGLSLVTFSRENEPEQCSTYLRVCFHALEAKLPQAIELVLEALNRVCYRNPQQLQDILLQCRMQMEQTVIGSGHSIGMKRVMAGVSAEGVVQECSGGYTMLQRIREMEKDPAALGEALHALSQHIFTTGRLTVGITGGQEDLPLAQLLAGLKHSEHTAPACAVRPWGSKHEGIIIPADISFSAMGGLCPYSGSMQVASQIVSLAYLWTTVRVQGGAYGAGMGATERGCGMFYSYRDPNATQSLKVFGQTADFLREFLQEQPDLTGFIIGTISGTEPVLLPDRQGRLADSWYFKGVTYADRCAMRKAILDTAPEALSAALPALQALAAHCGSCVVGSKAHVEACAPDTVYTL